MSRLTTAVAVCCLTLSTVAHAADKPQTNLATADWSVKTANNLRDRPPSKAAVYMFMNRFLGPDFATSPETAGEQLGENHGTLCSFQFVDLRHSGVLSLVAVYDLGGTGGCLDLTIIDKDPRGFALYTYNGGRLNDIEVSDILKTLKGDANIELVVRSFDVTAGHDDWPCIYAWTGASYTSVSSRYPKYYRDWLASVQKEIDELKKRQGSLEATPRVSAREIDERLALEAKIERFLGNKNAGMTEAIQWAKGSDSKERRLAAQIFADIGTPTALVYEQTLSHDPDRRVADLATRRIDSWGQEDPYNTTIGFECQKELGR